MDAEARANTEASAGSFIASQLPLYLSDTREFIDYKTSMITDEDPLRGLLFH